MKKKNDLIEEVVFQPYGKDELCINLVMSKKTLGFGVSDVEDLDALTKISEIHSYIQIRGRNPRYYKVVDPKLKLVNDSRAVFENRKLKKLKKLYAILLYNKTDEFIYMRYVESEEEYSIVKNKFNVIATFIVLAGQLRIIDEDTVHGVGYPRNKIAKLIKDLNEAK